METLRDRSTGWLLVECGAPTGNNLVGCPVTLLRQSVQVGLREVMNGPLTMPYLRVSYFYNKVTQSPVFLSLVSGWLCFNAKTDL